MKQPPLANAELAVMDLLWQEDRLTARHIREQLYPGTTKAQHGTVQVVRLITNRDTGRPRGFGFVEMEDDAAANAAIAAAANEEAVKEAEEAT